MALIKCPECGREKVSDSAITCPGCGFGIREYYNSKGKTKDYYNSKEKTNTWSTTNYLNGVRNNSAQQTNRYQYSHITNEPIPSSFPDKPDFNGSYTTGIIVGIVIIALGILIGMIVISNNYDHNDGIGIIVLGFSIGLGLIIGKVIRYKKDLDEYNNLIKSYEMMEKGIKLQPYQYTQIQYEMDRLAKLPECPICKSKANVVRISSLNRGLSVAMVGLASSKIGKQYECTHCNHKF